MFRLCVITISWAFGGSLFSKFSLIQFETLNEGENGPRQPFLAAWTPAWNYQHQSYQQTSAKFHLRGCRQPCPPAARPAPGPPPPPPRQRRRISGHVLCVATGHVSRHCTLFSRMWGAYVLMQLATPRWYTPMNPDPANERFIRKTGNKQILYQKQCVQ